MCLSIPSKVVEIREDNTAVVEVFGVRRVVSLELMQEEVHVGDWLLIHVGFAINKLSEEEALQSLELFEEILKEEEELWQQPEM
ncbi:hydrogenase assembly chaperone hypC/hupF [Thermocrinis albus DSM 14484]|uniref:Hydrogenase assembly chaperone hypC/hupF n=1 Tax=Thermocrinis albus (strain DSM 14484 / JCM 11386 / HI 11/12) TaxID=638303 RepID=D3SLP5_THEAH|nr:HypC/HybG/HupF family hydrogenase formation chaperone [Thermocrinis albus]ADC89675.1 hydrogenase assembly chaperone hypC/hupF [Thermocrinis albus DSM 14484]